MEKIVVLDAKAIPEAYPLLRPNFEHEWVSYDNSPYETLIERCKGATVLATSKCKLTREVLETVPTLKHIAVMATGFNNIDIEYCKEHNIAVSNIQGYSTESVAEHTFTMMLMLSRSMLQTRADMEDGKWCKSDIFFMSDYPIVDLKDKVLTVIGSGAIGSRIGEIGKAFGMRVNKAEHKGVTNIREGYTEFFKAISEADFISVNCPLNAQTQDLLTKSEFAKLKKSVIIVNNARGGVINEKDLTDAILDGTIAGAATDVVSKEPLDKDHPFVKLLKCKNFIITPHQAWCSHASLEELVLQLKDNMEAFYNGQTLRQVVEASK